VKTIDTADLELLAELVTDRYDGVQSGDISGYSGDREDELTYLNDLLGKLKALHAAGGLQLGTEYM